MNLLKLEFDCVITLQKKLFANQLKKPKETGKCGNLNPQNPILGKPEKKLQSKEHFLLKNILICQASFTNDNIKLRSFFGLRITNGIGAVRESMLCPPGADAI